MKKCFLASLLILFNVFYLFAGTANKYNFTEDKGSQSHPNGLATGMSFIQNEGQFIDTEQQMRPDILFKGDGGGVDAYLRKTGVSYVLTNIGEIISRVNEQIDALIRAGKLSESGERKKKDELMQEQLLKLNRVDVDFVGCIASSEVVGIDQLEGYNNYYYPYCPKGLTHVKSFNEVVMKNIYKNIDVRYYGGKSQGLKYDIVVNAGGNPDDIKLKYSGVEELQIKNYRLEVKTNINELGEYIPKVYQNIDGKIVDVEARYILSGTVVSFEFGTWNPSYPLVIDPWVTYFGGSNEERGLSVATDKQGNAVFTGYTSSNDFPSSPGAFQQSSTGGIKAFIVKMNPAGNRLFATYFGGTFNMGNGIATDGNNNIVITGINANGSTIPVLTPPGAYIQASSGSFIAKFDPTGVLIWSTYFNGGSDVACDATNNIFLCGASSGVPVMAAFQPAPAGGGDCFITKFSSAGVMQWSTYFGGTGNDQGIGITCDTFGNVFFTGLTSSTNFPTLSPFQPGLNGGTDSFVVKLNPATGFPVWSTYYGGNLTEGTNVDAAIAADNLGNVIITGSTNSTTGISTAGSFQPGNSSTGFSEGYVAKFSSTGNLLWATYLGGSGYEEPRGIATDNKNNIIVSGDTYSTNFPITSCAFQKSFLGTEDQFITTFDPNGKLICSGFLGAGNSSSTHNETIDGCGGIVAVDGCFVYLIASSWCIYPVTPNAYQFNCGGVWDATFAQLYVNTCGGVTSMINFSGNSTLCAGNTINFTSSYIGCDKTGITYLWTFPGGTPSTSTAVNPTGIAYNTPGTYPVKLVIQQPCGSDSLEKLNFITVNNCGCTMSASNAITTNVSCNGGNTGSATANVSGGTAPYTYLWSSGQTTQVVTGLTMGTYTVTATDSKGCTQPQVISIIQPEPINFNLSGTNVSCTSSGSASVFVLNGGSPPYIYSWSTGQTTASISGIPAGNYTVTVADGNGCKIVKAYTVTGTSPVSASFTASSACKGSVVNFTNTGTAPGSGVTYNWVISPISPANVSGTTTDFSYTFLSTGIYNVSHTVNSGGCSSNIVITITVVNCTAGPIVTTTANSVCPGYCATVTSIATGGASPYTYAWSNGSTTQNISPCPLSTTTYTVTIRDVGGNSATSTALVTVNPSVTATITQTNLTCAGSNNGSAQAIGAGGSPVYSYSWSNGGTVSQISNLSSQTYTVTITDSKGCTSISTTTIVSPPALTAQFAKGTASCTGCGCKEWLMVNATGGTGPYNYTWADGNVNRYKNQLCPGAYNVNIRDKNGCSINVNLTAP